MQGNLKNKKKIGKNRRRDMKRRNGKNKKKEEIKKRKNKGRNMFKNNF